MQKNYLFVVAAIAINVCSCTKDYTTTNVQSSPSGLMSSSAITVAANTKVSTSYGALIGAPGTSIDPYGFITDVAAKLGLSSIRDKAPVPGIKKVRTLTSGYSVLLNFTTINPMPMNFRTDISKYKTDLQNTIASLGAMPAVAVIENEESNTSYYKGTATDYLNELATAISVFHANGIPVANGGITSTGLTYLVYQDLVNRGLTSQAADYRSHMNLALGSSFTLDRANFVSTLISSYSKMNLDYVNFHWRSQSPGDSTCLGETIDYLQRTTGKPVITNEIGQYDQDPATLTATMQTCKNYKLPYILWYSCPDTKSFPLQNADESLTQTGNAYKGFIAK